MAEEEEEGGGKLPCVDHSPLNEVAVGIRPREVKEVRNRTGEEETKKDQKTDKMETKKEIKHF